MPTSNSPIPALVKYTVGFAPLRNLRVRRLNYNCKVINKVVLGRLKINVRLSWKGGPCLLAENHLTDRRLVETKRSERLRPKYRVGQNVVRPSVFRPSDAAASWGQSFFFNHHSFSRPQADLINNIIGNNISEITANINLTSSNVCDLIKLEI